MIGYRPYRQAMTSSGFRFRTEWVHQSWRWICFCAFDDWLMIYLPLWKIWLRQLGLWTSQYMESHKIHVPNHQPVEYLSGWLPKKHIDEFLTAKLSKSPDLAIASDERVKRLIFEPFPVIGGLWNCFPHMIKLYYIYNTLWIQTLSQKVLNP